MVKKILLIRNILGFMAFFLLGFFIFQNEGMTKGRQAFGFASFGISFELSALII